MKGNNQVRTTNSFNLVVSLFSYYKRVRMKKKLLSDILERVSRLFYQVKNNDEYFSCVILYHEGLRV